MVRSDGSDPGSASADGPTSLAGRATPTAAILLIGDELLSGKVRDENGWFLITALRARGIPTRSLVMVPDDYGEIIAALERLCTAHDLVFSSGGVGPTHDDLTLEAVSRWLNRPLVRNARMESILRAHFAERLTEASLRMADLPAGTELLADDGWPVMHLALTRPEGPRRLFVLPGIPGLLRAKFRALERLDGALPEGERWALAELETPLEESRFADVLRDVVADYPDVQIGSYPRYERNDDGHLVSFVRLTFEAPEHLRHEATQARDQTALALARLRGS